MCKHGWCRLHSSTHKRVSAFAQVSDNQIRPAIYICTTLLLLFLVSTRLGPVNTFTSLSDQVNTLCVHVVSLNVYHLFVNHLKGWGQVGAATRHPVRMHPHNRGFDQQRTCKHIVNCSGVVG